MHEPVFNVTSCNSKFENCCEDAAALALINDLWKYPPVAGFLLRLACAPSLVLTKWPCQGDPRA